MTKLLNGLTVALVSFGLGGCAMVLKAGGVPANKVVDCSLVPPSDNSVKSLLSWSNKFHGDAASGRDAAHACEEATRMRAQAHCKDGDPVFRDAVVETAGVCPAEAAAFGFKAAEPPVVETEAQ